jgi:flagellar basal-body rod protein FlgB
MAINFSNALGISEQALMVREARAQVLANNLANADTPGFKARDVDFRQVLRAAASESEHRLQRSHPRHLGDAGGVIGQPPLQYRAPTQPSIDGNTVDPQIEMAEFARNALDFQASLTFIKSRFSGLKSAIGNQ